MLRQVVVALFLMSTSLAQITWQGYNWHVKEGTRLGPGPNNWASKNAYVDSNGGLHLKITNDGGVWNCAEVWTTQNFGFGTYQWQIDGQIDQFDREIVLGLFHYNGPDGINEIDIEYALWGVADNHNGWWTVYPSTTGYSPTSNGFPFTLSGTYTTSRYNWTSTGVNYRLLGGFQPLGSNTNTMQSWDFVPSPSSRVPQRPMSVHMNLWLFQGRVPADGKEVEIVIKGYQQQLDN